MFCGHCMDEPCSCDSKMKAVDLSSPIFKTAVKKDGVIYSERYTNHSKVASNNNLTGHECGFENDNGEWLDRKKAFIVALYNNQLDKLALQFLAQRLMLSYDLREIHYGLDSMWLKTDDEGKIV